MSKTSPGYPFHSPTENPDKMNPMHRYLSNPRLASCSLFAHTLIPVLTLGIVGAFFTAVPWAQAQTPAITSNLYVSDFAASAIYGYSTTGSQSTFASDLVNPVGLAFDSAGNLYEADSGTGKIYKSSAAGGQTVFASGFDHVLGLAFDGTGNLFAATLDANNVGSIIEITPAGVQSTFATGLTRVRGLAFDGAGNLYEAELDTGNVSKFTPAGVQSTFASGFNYPTGIAFDGTGNLFVCSQGVGVFEVSPTGAVSTFTTDVTDPRYLAFDTAGNLYVCDVGDATGTSGQGNVYEFTPAGARTTFASNLAFPSGIVFTPTLTTTPVTLPSVSVAATDDSVYTSGDTYAAFTVSLSAVQTTDTVVSYTLKGSATNGTDYAYLKGTVKIKAGKTGKVIKVVPMGDLGGASKKTVKLALSSGNSYGIGTPDTAKVKILQGTLVVLP